MQAQQQLEKTADRRDQSSVPPKTSSKKVSGIISGALSFVVLIIIGIFALEGIFRLAHIGESETQKPDAILGSVHIPNKLVTFRTEGYSRETLNSQGMRDVEHSLNKPAGVKRIAILGDSTTEAMQVALDETYCRQLENQLNADAERNKLSARYEVLNFGCAGYSTGQEYLQYQKEVRQHKPDLVVVLYNFNDSAENIFVPQSADKITPRPLFHLANNALVEDDTVLQMNAQMFKPNPVMNFLRHESRIFGVFSQQNLMLTINEPLYVKIKRVISKIPFPGSKRQDTNIIRPGYSLPDPMAVTARLLTELNSDVQNNNGKLCLLTFPNVSHHAAFAKEEATLIETGRRQNFEVVSLTPAFSQAPDYGSLFLKYHFSKFGHAVVAQVLSTFIEQQK